MGVRLNSEKKIENDSFKLKIGTTNKINPMVIYVEGKAFISPEDDKEDYAKDIAEIKHVFKQSISDGLCTTDVFDNKYIIDLLSEKRDKVIRSFIVDKDGPVVFPYLKQGSYCIRITEDKNRNSLVDTGVLLEKRQPEKVRFFKPDDQFLIKVLERAEMVWKIDLKEMFQ